jgi:spermidine/putrescine transport system substrate-binding protein
MKKNPKNWTIIAVVVIAVCGILTTQATAASKPFEGQKLIVGIWSGPYAKNFEASIGQGFEELTGAELLYKYSWDFTPEIMASPEDDPPLDVTLTADADYLVGVNNKLWLPIRYANVPNSEKIFPIIRNEISPNTEFGVPFDAAIHILMYRKDLVQTPPTSWKDLLTNEQFDGKIAIERWFPYWIYIGSYLTDYDPPTEAIYSPEGREAIFDAMKKLSERWFFCYDKGAEFWAALDAGEILAGNYWNGSATAQIQAQIEKEGKATTYAMTLPKEGAVAYLDHFCVVRGTEKRDLAEAFINYAVSTAGQKAFLNSQYNLIVNQEAVADVPTVLADIHPKTDSDWKKISFIDAPTLEPMRKKLEERFVKEVLSQ